MRLRLSHNGKGSPLPWQLTTPKAPHQRILYAEAVLLEAVEFEVSGADGWAVGNVLGVVGAAHPNGVTHALTYERVLAMENDAIAHLRSDGWVSLIYERHAGFKVHGVVVPGVSQLLVSPGLCVCRP